MNRRLAILALALAEGVGTADPGVDDVILSGFSDLAEAGEAHAYLAGFLLQTLAAARHETISETSAYVRRLLEASG